MTRTAVTYSGDDSPCKEEGAAEVPHAALIGGVTRGIDPCPDSNHHLLRMREQVSGIISKNVTNHFKLKPKTRAMNTEQTLKKIKKNSPKMKSHNLLPSHSCIFFFVKHKSRYYAIHKRKNITW